MGRDRPRLSRAAGARAGRPTTGPRARTSSRPSASPRTGSATRPPSRARATSTRRSSRRTWMARSAARCSRPPRTRSIRRRRRIHARSVRSWRSCGSGSPIRNEAPKRGERAGAASDQPRADRRDRMRLRLRRAPGPSDRASAKPNSAPLPVSAVRPHPAAHRPNQAVRDVQPDAGTRATRGRRRPGRSTSPNGWASGSGAPPLVVDADRHLAGRHLDDDLDRAVCRRHTGWRCRAGCGSRG